jgi:hypothetical protein
VISYWGGCWTWNVWENISCIHIEVTSCIYLELISWSEIDLEVTYWSDRRTHRRTHKRTHRRAHRRTHRTHLVYILKWQKREDQYWALYSGSPPLKGSAGSPTEHMQDTVRLQQYRELKMCAQTSLNGRKRTLWKRSAWHNARKQKGKWLLVKERCYFCCPWHGHRLFQCLIVLLLVMSIGIKLNQCILSSPSTPLILPC